MSYVIVVLVAFLAGAVVSYFFAQRALEAVKAEFTAIGSTIHARIQAAEANISAKIAGAPAPAPAPAPTGAAVASAPVPPAAR